jgi:hypothetical protein
VHRCGVGRGRERGAKGRVLKKLDDAGEPRGRLLLRRQRGHDHERHVELRCGRAHLPEFHRRGERGDRERVRDDVLGLRVRQRDGPPVEREARGRAPLARDGSGLERRANVTGREELARERPNDRLRRRGGQPREAQNHERESTRGGDRRTMDRVILVALLTGPATGQALDDAGAARLGADLELTAYEARMTVAQGYPAVVATRADAERASILVARLRAGGCDAVGVDSNEIVPSEAMIAMDRFAFEPGAVVVGRERLELADILCLVRATHRTRSETETTTTERRFSAGRSLLTGGLSNTTTVTKRATESAESREQVLYVFRRSGQTPWILREQGRHYEGLGEARGRTAVENFATTTRLLRERAPTAAYDERLVGRARFAERSAVHGTGARSTVTSSSAAGVDALAHLVALAVGGGGAGPYRR